MDIASLPDLLATWGYPALLVLLLTLALPVAVLLIVLVHDVLSMDRPPSDKTKQAHCRSVRASPSSGADGTLPSGVSVGES